MGGVLGTLLEGRFGLDAHLSGLDGRIAELTGLPAERFQLADGWERLGRLEEDLLQKGRPYRTLKTARILAGRELRAAAEQQSHDDEALRAEVPPSLLELLRIPGVGPRTAGEVWRELGIATLARGKLDETAENRARGRGTRILKRTAHITVILSEG